MDVDATNARFEASLPNNPVAVPSSTSMTPPVWHNSLPVAPIPIGKARNTSTSKNTGEPAAKKPKLAETSSSSTTHSTSPVPRTSSPTSSAPTQIEPKSKDAAPKKKTAVRSKKATANATTTSSATTKRSETNATGDYTPLRAENRAALDAMGLSWQEPRYQPHPSTHPSKMVISTSNSSKRVTVHMNLAVNGRGYNLVRANYPVQSGNWYYELQVTDAPTFLEQLQSYQEMQAKAELERDHSPIQQQEPEPPAVIQTNSATHDLQSSATHSSAMETDPTSSINDTSFTTDGQIRSDTPSFVAPNLAPLHTDIHPSLAFGTDSSAESSSIHPITSGEPSHHQMDATDTSVRTKSTASPSEVAHVSNDISSHENVGAAPQDSNAPTISTTFPNIDLSGYSSMASGLSDLDHLHDSTRRSLPAPHWRIGWATEQADKESPVGTDMYGFAWRDDGTLFHTARPIETVIRRNMDIALLSDTQTSQTSQPSGLSSATTTNAPPTSKSPSVSSSSTPAPSSAPLKITSAPSIEIIDDRTTDTHQDSLCHLDSFTNGDILGFGIELPDTNLDFIKSLHEHQEKELSQQDDMLRFRRIVHYSQTALSHPGADQVTLKAQISESQEKIAAMKPVPPLETPVMLKGARLTFYKNGVLQGAAVLDIPPGSYYPAFSLYYRGAVLVNFGPNFAYPPSVGFRPASELPDAYQIPIPDSKFLPVPSGP